MPDKPTYEELEQKIKELEKRTEFFQFVSDNSVDWELFRNPEGKILYCNKAFEHLTGYLVDELLNGEISEKDFTHPDDWNMVIEQMLKTAKTLSTETDIEFRIITKNKQIRTINLNSQPVFKDNLLLGFRTSIRDVTDNKIKQALKASEELFRDIVSNNPDHILIQDTDLKYTFVINPQLGFTQSDMIGKTDYDLMNKEDAEKITIIKQNVINTAKPVFIETSFMSKSGELEYFRGTYTPKFDNSGKINGLFGYFRNITQLKQIESELSKSEEKFKLIFEKSSAPIVIADDNGNYLVVNKAASKLFDFTVDEMLHMNVGDLITTSNADAAAQYEEYIIKGEGKGEFDFISKNGTHKIVKYNAVRIMPDFNLSIMMDISEENRILEELKLAKLNAEELMNSKQQFLSNMSHEIRTPMNSIVGFTKILLKTNLNDLQKEYLHAIKTSGEVLIVLINDILDLAKVDAGKMVFEKRTFKLHESISSIIHLFEHKTREKNLELIKEYNTKIPAVLKGDSGRLHQIMLNLLSNAVKFTSEGRITVIVDFLGEDDEKVAIEFTVKDTGIGIPENKMDKIFDSFEQASAIISSVYGGTGLGLAISKQLVELQGGSISVKSDAGKGSSFSFILNFEKTTDTFETEPDSIELIKEIENLNVLVVEDVMLNQLLLKTILNDFGFKYDVAENGLIAIEKLQSNVYDIILMDLMMPEMNGFEATEYIRNKMNSKIPIIALTADVTTVDIEKCKAHGMDDYISKPIDEKLLLKKIVSLVK
ncbi:MAG: PAS domain S-box protein [Bacteroidetes bacterium]|nr:PAS domain S-box protein [Bacteroidota bacterium]